MIWRRTFVELSNVHFKSFTFLFLKNFRNFTIGKKWEIHSQLLKCSTARGSSSGLSLIGPTMVEAQKSFLFTEGSLKVESKHYSFLWTVWFEQGLKETLHLFPGCVQESSDDCIQHLKWNVLSGIKVLTLSILKSKKSFRNIYCKSFWFRASKPYYISSLLWFRSTFKLSLFY